MTHVYITHDSCCHMISAVDPHSIRFSCCHQVHLTRCCCHWSVPTHQWHYTCHHHVFSRLLPWLRRAYVSWHTGRSLFWPLSFVRRHSLAGVSVVCKFIANIQILGPYKHVMTRHGEFVVEGQMWRDVCVPFLLQWIVGEETAACETTPVQLQRWLVQHRRARQSPERGNVVRGAAWL